MAIARPSRFKSLLNASGTRPALQCAKKGQLTWKIVKMRLVKILIIYIWHSNKNTDGLVNRFVSNMVILNQAHRVAWIVGQISQVPRPRKGLTDQL